MEPGGPEGFPGTPSPRARAGVRGEVGATGGFTARARRAGGGAAGAAGAARAQGPSGRRRRRRRQRPRGVAKGVGGSEGRTAGGGAPVGGGWEQEPADGPVGPESFCRGARRGGLGGPCTARVRRKKSRCPWRRVESLLDGAAGRGPVLRRRLVAGRE